MWPIGANTLNRNELVKSLRHQQRRLLNVGRAALMVLLIILTWTKPGTADTGEISSQRLAPGDRISVTVFGQTELSGDFIVDGSGSILFPLVGSIEVRNLTLPECQKLVTDRLADGILNNPSVSVRLAEPRPIYVLGDVKVPGSYPYRYGSLVKTAVAQAGGFGFAEQSPGAALSEFLVADERVRVLSTSWRALTIRQARLEAQLNGAETFTAPTLPSAENDTSQSALITQETEIFATENEAVKKRSDLVQSQRPQLLLEIKAIEGQIDAERQQIGLVQAEIDQYAKLSEKGLTKSSSMLDLKLALSSRQSNVWRLEAELSKIKNSIMEFDRAVQDVEAARKKQILIDLQDVRQRLREIEVTLPSAQEVRTLKFQQTGGAVGATVARDISITRLRNNEVTTLQANESDLLEPGDVVEIRRLPSNNGLNLSANDQKTTGGVSSAHPPQ